ncbi:MAG: hypothetical protein IKQ80_07875 [Clostridia bacterium]|nr:hypothetical protein [Clostridia bacterium]
MSAIKKKLKSKRGASITFALLLFLVCAVASSVVIVAASTAGGRLSTVKEMDQRYFAATAFARTLNDRLDGKSATVTYQKDEEDIITPTNVDDIGILGTVSKALIQDPNMASVTILAEDMTKTVDQVEYTCSVAGKLEKGLLVCDIAVTGGRINNGTYTLRAIYAPTVMKEVEIQGTGGTKTGKANVTWKKSSIKKISGGG